MNPLKHIYSDLLSECAAEVNGEVNTGERNFFEINRQGLKREVC